MLGDGDGRFLAALLKQNIRLTADVVDTSAAMLELLRKRCGRSAPNVTTRIRTHQTDAISYLAAPFPAPCDLVVTHFFLDCLTQDGVDTLASTISTRLPVGAVWLISDFRIPPGALSLPATLLVRSLYLAFRILTGLRTNRLPDHASTLSSNGFSCAAKSRSLFGILTTELWILTALPLGL